MKNLNIDELCRRGEQSNEWLKQGRFREAQGHLLKILKELDGVERLDSFILAKTTLALLLTHIKLGEFQKAFSLWNSQSQESIAGLGIYALEHAQTGIEDLICYDFACAYLHSLSAEERITSARAVNQYMSRICEHYRDSENHEGLLLALSNWKQHLREIFGLSLPHDIAKPLIEFERLVGRESVRLRAIEFPLPGAWERPEGFNELTQVSLRRRAR